jgi:hypothetical protein
MWLKKFSPINSKQKFLTSRNLTSLKFFRKITFNKRSFTVTATSVDQELLASTLTGLGLWRLRPFIVPQLTLLISRIEGIIRQSCFDDGLDVVHIKQFEYMDSLDPTGEKDAIDPFFATYTPNCKKSGSRPLRIQSESRAYTSRFFRRINLSISSREDGLQIFHMVAFPRFEFDFPVLHVHLMARKTKISLAVIDSSPVKWDRSLPEFYTEMMSKLQNQFSLDLATPKWNEEVCSAYSVALNSSQSSRFDQFAQYACSLIRAHFEVARIVTPTRNPFIIEEIKASQNRFCATHQKNEEIFRILSASYGEKKTRDYLTQFLFDLNNE